MGGGDKLPWTACTLPLNLALEIMRQRKQRNWTGIMFIIDTSSYSDCLK